MIKFEKIEFLSDRYLTEEEKVIFVSYLNDKK